MVGGMEYHEAANFLLDMRRFRPKPGTDSTADLLSHLDDPHDGTTFVQIAGSNGKGSTARMTESILREAGLSVGLYTSPHFDDFRERIRVDGRKITKDAISTFVSQVRPYVESRTADGNAPTFFEMLTVLALWHFDAVDVDVAVLEVGIGGRYDATSVVEPAASAVTSVTLEHTGILGETIEEIARDKAHVAPATRPLVTGADGAARRAIEDWCREHRTDEAGGKGDHGTGGKGDHGAGGVITVGGGAETSEEDVDVVVRYGGRTNGAEAAISIEAADWEVETRIPLLGSYQATNAGIAATLARQVAPVSDRELARGLRTARWPGRFEVMGHSPLVVLDGAHNPGACEQLGTVLSEFDYDRLFLVIGAMHDKDHRGMARALPTPDRVYTCRPPLERAENPEILATVFERAGAGSVESGGSVADVLATALDAAGPDDCVLVTGSLYTVGVARSRWTRATIPKRVRNRSALDAVLAGRDVNDGTVDRLRAAGVHRALATRVQRREATILAEELRAAGGDVARSAIRGGDEEALDVALFGTLSQYEELFEALENRSCGRATLADELRRALGRETESAERGYPWEERTAVMGILNVTPDSFHDGGRYETVEAAVAQAEAMIAAGADVIDVGGESTRPGAEPVGERIERERVVPVVERLADLDVMLSVDTRKSTVARAALEAGADMLNDVSGLEDPAMPGVAAEYDVPLVVMHSIDAPVVPDRRVDYDDVVEDVVADLVERVLLAEKAGLDRDAIVIDPGLGFGKSPAENFELLGRTDELRALGCPVLIGHSNKSMFDRLATEPTDRPDGTSPDRLPATVAGTALAVARGADVVRVHDVAANVAAVRTVEAAVRTVDVPDDQH